MIANILIVEDDQDMCLMLKEGIESKGHSCSYAVNGHDALEKFTNAPYDIVITDLNIPGINGIELCKNILEINSRTPVIVITAFGTMDTAVEALRSGAYDFISKPFDMETIFHTLKRTVEYLDLSNEVETYRNANENSFEGIIGNSQVLNSLIANIKIFAQTDAAILISGESGTGKELIARALHKCSPRADKPFVAINCSALAENLLESELFGHVQGAYTDAKKSRRGLFQKATEGTIFLDEIGDMPVKLQAKLLRALEEKRTRPVGSDKSFELDARVICATNRDLKELIENNLFREDLYYRINVLEMNVPSLRERQSDILLLAQNFINVFCAKYSKQNLSLSRHALDLINSYRWPGNVRELKNSIEHAVIVCQGEKITPSDLPERVHGEAYSKEDLNTPLSVIERNHILKIYKSTDNNKDETAKILELSKRTLYRRLEEYSKQGYI